MKKSFTLMELMAVLVIIGILAAIGIPSYMKAIERSRAAEAVTILGSIRSAQQRFHDEHATYGNLVDLDVQIDDTTNYFDYHAALGDDGCGCSPRVAYAVRRQFQDTLGQYALCIQPDGQIVCADVGCTGAAAPACAQLGY